ncbi:MAG: hypothetical protein IT201_03220 [Thermoleophilia bacterium]|nr:hypothetical protein [Thermoleophilia bacterium]
MRASLLTTVAALAATLAVASGAAAATPVFDPASFVRGVDNPYLPLVPGTVYHYEGVSEGIIEHDRVAVTRKTKTILGVECVVVLDTVTARGRPVERTRDWYAQDADGNVWYLGEASFDYVGGRWVESDGSWQAGVDGAEAGIVMLAQPAAGTVYHQEYYPGHAEDTAQVLRTLEERTVPYGTFADVLLTREWTPLTPGVFERKLYAPGIGLIEARATKGEVAWTKLVGVVHR